MDILFIFFGSLFGGLLFGYWFSFKKGEASWKIAIFGFIGWCMMVITIGYSAIQISKNSAPMQDCKKVAKDFVSLFDK